VTFARIFWERRNFCAAPGLRLERELSALDETKGVAR